jgi:epoxyqueuosine reductase
MDEKGNISRDWMKDLIRDFIAISALNSMQMQSEAGDPAWDDALVGFASGADPIWQQ